MDEDGAFSTHDLWRPSVFTVGSHPEDSIFEGLRVNEPSGLEPKHSKATNLFEGLLDDFDLPALEDETNQSDLASGLSQDLDAKALTDHPGDQQLDEHDVWDFDAEAKIPQSEPQLHTWEAFQLGNDQPPNTIYFSEAGDNAFNALFQQREQSAGIIQHDVTLRSCCSLVLGRSSTLFQWDQAKASFRLVLESVTVSGLSLECSRGLVEQFIDMGTTFRRLLVISAQSNSKDCTAMVAVRRSLADVLDHIERHVCGLLANVQSLLQLQQATNRSSYILRYFNTLLGRLRHVRNDEALISMLSDDVTSLAESGSILTEVMENVLAHASTPWLRRLAEDVGLASGLQQGYLAAPDDDAHTDAPSKHGATFLPIEDNRHLLSVKRSISLLRQHVPSHPVVKPSASTLKEDILQMALHLDPDVVLRRANDYKDQMIQAITDHRRGSRLTASSEPEQSPEIDIHINNDPFAIEALEKFAPLEHEIPPETPSSNHVYSRLRSSLDLILSANDRALLSDLTYRSSDLLAPLRPFLDVQSFLVNGAVLNYVFNTYRLRDHLELHRSYHLFGNGDFVTRLTTALFSSEVQTAERKRGNIPTSETMGLRLDSRESQRWPPASSELRLTLLNILNESYAPHEAQKDISQLPGGLSFAIRELTDAEIDRVMDPTSIYALDFLRLQYTPPDPLADIFTPTIAQHYDVVFRTLLVHVRVLHATAQLAALCNKQVQQTPSSIGRQMALRRFAWKSRHLSTTIFSHFTDTVIAGAWKTFAEHLDKMHPGEEAAQDRQPSPSVDLHSITRLHESCLNDIRAKLFVRQKHAKIRTVLEQLAAVVIKTTLGVMRDTTGRDSVAEQDAQLDALSAELRSLLEVIANKISKDDRDAAHMQYAQSESDAAKLLLARLSWQLDMT